MAARIDAFRRGCVPAPLVRSSLWALRDAVCRRARLRHATGDLLRCALQLCGCPARVGRPWGCPHTKNTAVKNNVLAGCKALATSAKAKKGRPKRPCRPSWPHALRIAS